MICFCWQSSGKANMVCKNVPCQHFILATGLFSVMKQPITKYTICTYERCRWRFEICVSGVEIISEKVLKRSSGRRTASINTGVRVDSGQVNFIFGFSKSNLASCSFSNTRFGPLNYITAPGRVTKNRKKSCPEEHLLTKEEFVTKTQCCLLHQELCFIESE